jgi:hypothetical protein
MMDLYVYMADVYCADCGRAKRKLILEEGNAPADWRDERTYDSDEFPKGPYRDEESDSPQHCGAGRDCLNALVLSDGIKVGAFLENPLTTEGERYVRELHRDSRSEVTQLWMDFYDLSDEPDESEDAQ